MVNDVFGLKRGWKSYLRIHRNIMHKLFFGSTLGSLEERCWIGLDSKINEASAIQVNRSIEQNRPARTTTDRVQRPEKSWARSLEGEKEACVDPKYLAAAAKEVNSTLEALQHSLRFRVHDGTDRVQVMVIDANDKVLKEIPPDQMLELATKIEEMAKMFQKMVGVLVDEFV